MDPANNSSSQFFQH